MVQHQPLLRWILLLDLNIPLLKKKLKVPWLASKATFRPPLNAGSMALGSTTCRGQRHGVGTGGERGTEWRGERTGSTGEAGNGQGTANGESDGDEEANGEECPHF